MKIRAMIDDEPNNTNNQTKNEICTDDDIGNNEDDSEEDDVPTSWRLAESVRGGGGSGEQTESVYADAVSESSGSSSRNDESSLGSWDERLPVDRWAARLVRCCAWIVAWQSLVTLLSSSSSSIGRDELLLEVCVWVCVFMFVSTRTHLRQENSDTVVLCCWQYSTSPFTHSSAIQSCSDMSYFPCSFFHTQQTARPATL